MNFLFIAYFAVYGNLAVSFSAGIGGAAPKWCGGLHDTRGWGTQPSACFSLENKNLEKNNLREVETFMRKNKGTQVRLDPDLRKKLENESLETGLSIPEILKKSYLSREPVKLLMPHNIATQYILKFNEISEQLNKLIEYSENNDLREHLTLLTDIADNQKILTNLIGMHSGND